MATQYAVTVSASRTEVEPETLAERIAELLDRPVVEVEEVVCDRTVVLQEGLNYREAVQIQQELSRRKIPSQVSAIKNLSGREVRLSAEESGGTADERDDAEGSAPADDEDVSAWAEMFPDLAGQSDLAEGDEKQQAAKDDAADQKRTPAPSAPTSPENLGWTGVEPEGSVDDEVGFGIAVADRDGVASEVTVDDRAGEEEERFDANKIHQAFAAGDDDRPPFKPKSYDGRPEHVPLIAALLSLVAPGAGQVFNGQSDKAQHYAVMFVLIYPWFDAVRQALNYGEKVRTYYAPRPEEGTGKKALGFALKWWAVVATVGILVGWMGSTVQDHLDHREQQRQQRVFQELTFYGEDTVADGVRDGLQAAKQAHLEMDEEEKDQDDGRYTMDDEERARRLFIIGYHYCGGHNFDMCQQLMSRVTSLAPSNRDAYRLQAWASMQMRTRDREAEMPDIDGEVPTLREFEIKLASEGTSIEELDEEFDDWWDDEGEAIVGGGVEEAGEEGALGEETTTEERASDEYGEWWDEWLDDEDEQGPKADDDGDEGSERNAANQARGE